MNRLTGRPTEAEPVPSRRPRVLFIGKGAYVLPLSPGLARKWNSVADRVDFRLIAKGGAVEQDDPRFRLLRLSRWVTGTFYLALPWVVAQEVRRFRPDVVVTQSPYEALPVLAVLPVLRCKPKLVVEVQGDWRSAARLYGSRFRRLFAGVSDRAAMLALRRADGTRATSEFTAALAEDATNRKPLGIYPTYSDIESFLARPPEPLPGSPTVAWIGMLQPVKDPETFAAAWRIVAARLPEARAIVVGDGPLRPVIDALCAEFPERVRRFPRLSPPEVARILDESTVLVLPSRSEGLPRVAIEAFARGRPVVGSAAGGTPDIVRAEHSGLLVPPGDPTALGDAVARVLSDRPFADHLAAGALSDGKRFQWPPERHADAVRELVDRALALP
jgi:glycosyltransferase involved in cell wall biosynthesis